VIQPRFGVAGLLYIHFHGLHPWLFTLNPAGSDRQKQIAKRLNVNNHVLNVWLMNIRLTPTRWVGMFIENRMARKGATSAGIEWCAVLFLHDNQFYNRYFSSNSIPCSLSNSTNSSLKVTILWCSS